MSLSAPFHPTTPPSFHISLTPPVDTTLGQHCAWPLSWACTCHFIYFAYSCLSYLCSYTSCFLPCSALVSFPHLLYMNNLYTLVVPMMIALSGASDMAIHTQIAESISLIAELKFPEQWPNLVHVHQWMNLTDFTYVLPATHTITQQQQHEHQPQCAWDCTLYLPQVSI